MFRLECIDIQHDLVTDILSDITRYVEQSVSKKQSGCITLVGVSSEEIQVINHQYRNKNISTDVLSFPYMETFTGQSDDVVVGEILICHEQILTQSKEHGNSIEYEYYKLIIHGIVHILGYDHETDEQYTVMSKIEQAIYEKLQQAHNIFIY